MRFKGLAITAMMALIVLVAMVPAAQATLNVRITENGGAPTTCTGALVVTCVTSDATFLIDVQTGTTNNPGPASITINGTVDATGSGTNTLLVETSDTSFLIPTGGANLIQTVNTNTPATLSATGSIVGVGGFSNNNDLFCIANADCTATTANVSFGSFVVGNAGTSAVSGNFIAPFSMDEQLKYTFTGTGTALVTATLSAIVPEPASMTLLGGALLFVAGAIRRKAKKA